jgi:hypothetical protein
MLNLQAGAATSYNTPKINRNCLQLCTKIGDFNMCVVHRTIHEFSLHGKMLPMVKAVLTKLQGSNGYKGQVSSLLEIFKALGFQWSKM